MRNISEFIAHIYVRQKRFVFYQIVLTVGDELFEVIFSSHGQPKACK